VARAVCLRLCGCCAGIHELQRFYARGRGVRKRKVVQGESPVQVGFFLRVVRTKGERVVYAVYSRFVYCICKTDQMKHLLTVIACCLAVAGSAQTWNPDADFDNVIGVNDLMELLSVFGTEWTATYPQDPAYELAAYHAGSMDYFECYRSCINNHGKIIGIQEYAMFQDSIHALGEEVSLWLEDWRGWMSIDGPLFGTFMALGIESNQRIYLYPKDCVCAGLVPVVE